MPGERLDSVLGDGEVIDGRIVDVRPMTDEEARREREAYVDDE
ncbi:hypothetical protein ACFQGT_16340 [Natrialbaceae archaeon GCM10025810]